jgi:HAD superfamily hydrolase (TIGR01549 family)
MIDFSKYKAIFWDFDGVLMDSMPVRDMGFERVLRHYPQEQVAALMAYHRANGGLSRYAKFRYFFEVIRKEPATDEQILALAGEFSDLMRRELVNESLLIRDSIQFVKKHHARFRMHVVSGSDQAELRFLLASLNLDRWFVSIHGSPQPKPALVAQLCEQYEPSAVLLIGDSINDLQAAQAGGVDFAGYNNAGLMGCGVGYIHRFDQLNPRPYAGKD